MSLLVLVLVLMLQFSIIFPAVAGDCYDDPPNNKSYDNCATCYQTLANALLNGGDNKYQLGRAFFPDDTVPPIEVRVVYTPASQCNTSNYSNCDSEQGPDDSTTSTWYWLVGEVYVFFAIGTVHCPFSLLLSTIMATRMCCSLCP